VLTRKFGRTGLDVSALCLGGNVFGWTIDKETSFAVLDASATSVEQVRELLGAVALKLTEEEMRLLDKVSA
jgi:aryl-alcohol dehydrogenase-like predicted oxidoreductase